MPHIYDMGPTALLPLRRKVCWGFFGPKNLTDSAGFEPPNLGTKGQHATSRPPPVHSFWHCNTVYLFSLRLVATQVQPLTVMAAYLASSWSGIKMQVSYVLFKNVYSDRNYEFIPDRVNVFEIGITLPARSEDSHSATTPCRLQLWSVFGNSASKLFCRYCSFNKQTFHLIVSRCHFRSKCKYRRHNNAVLCVLSLRFLGR